MTSWVKHISHGLSEISADYFPKIADILYKNINQLSTHIVECNSAVANSPASYSDRGF